MLPVHEKLRARQTDAISTEAYRLFVNVALLAVELQRMTISRRIGSALQALRPDLPHAFMIDAMAEFRAGRAAESVVSCRTVLEKFPDYQMAKAFLGVAMMHQKVGGWQTILEEVIEDGRDEGAIGLACTALDRSQPSDSFVGAPGSTTVVPAPTFAANAVWA